MNNNILYTFSALPVSVCTQTGSINPEVEKLIPAEIVINDDGLINLKPWVDPSEIYLSQHNNSIGKTWYEHNIEFTKFISDFEKKNIVDVGGGSGNIYKAFSKHYPDINWKIVDLNPTINDDRIEIIRGLYDPKFINENDTVVTSHFIEHQFNISEFLTSLRLRNPKYHIFSLPNFSEYARSNYSATIMFEHPNYLSENYLEYILSITGWKIIDKKYYKKHSIFYTTEPSNNISNVTPKRSETDKNSDVFEIKRFLKYMSERVNSIKSIPDKFYVYGAHFTYYYLLNMGISPEQIIAVVDGDPMKQGKRMYGTTHKIISPQELPDGARIFVEMGPYNDEIIKHSLSKNVKLI